MRNWTVKIQHIFHEVNKVTDCIAKSCSSNKYDLEIIDFLVYDVRQLLLEDKIKDFHIRSQDCCMLFLLYQKKKKRYVARVSNVHP